MNVPIETLVKPYEYIGPFLWLVEIVISKVVHTDVSGGFFPI